MQDGSFVDRLRDEAALESTFGKAARLSRDRAVTSCEVTEGAIGEVVDLQGTVRGSAGSEYRVSAALDLEQREFIDYTCTCPAAINYLGMCKHEIALVLHYLQESGLEDVPSVARWEPVFPVERGAFEGVPSAHSTDSTYAGATVGGGIRRGDSYVRPYHAALPTSDALKDLIGALTDQRVREASRGLHVREGSSGQPDQPVDLLCTLMRARNAYLPYYEAAWCVKLKIVRGKTGYVVKHVAALVDAYRSHAFASYGKSLAFDHVPEAFSPRARQLLDVLGGIVDSQRALVASDYRYTQAGSGAEGKELPVCDADIIKIFDLHQGDRIAYAADPYGGGATDLLEITEGDPLVRISIRLAPHGGYDLALPANVRCITDGTSFYLVDPPHAYRCSDEYASRAQGVLPALLGRGSTLHIADQDALEFCRALLPRLRACCDLACPAELDALVPPDPAFSFKIGLEDGEVSCNASVAYNDWSADLYKPVRPGQPSRDLVAEYHVQDVLERYFPRAEEGLRFDESDDELLFILLTDGVSDLMALGEVLLSERLRAIAVRPAPVLSVRAQVKSGLLDVEVDASGLSDADLFAYLASYKRRQKFVRLSDGDIMRVEGGIRAIDDLSNGLGVDPEDLALGVHGLPSNRTLFVDELLRRTEGVRLSRNAEFRAIVRDFDTYADADFEVPASLAGVLRGYQVDGFRWLETLGRFGFGGILADDMGLGKTLQMIAHILARKEAGERESTLIVCPASLVYNWMAELARFAPSLDAVAVLGSKTVRRQLIGASEEHDVLVTSYDLMKRDVEELSGHAFARIVLDEAQYIKNARTQVAKCAKCLNGREHFALTGTPVENRLGELWSIFDFLMPGILGTRESFAKRFEAPVTAGEFDASHRLSCMVAPFILRRLKADVLADLPEKTESVVYAQLTGEQDKLYRAAQDRVARQVGKELSKDFKKKKLQVLAGLTRLRQICCDPRLGYDGYAGGSAKLDTCMELVGNAVDGGHQVLLFSQFTGMLDLIAERLREMGAGYLMLTGATSKEDRARLVERFQAGEVPVFLISLKAGGTGLNLTAADVVIHYDPWWNVAAQNQATDRAHRIGQQRSVSVFKIIAKDTIEERILKMQETKSDLAESVLSGTGSGVAELTRDDFLLLLGASEG